MPKPTQIIGKGIILDPTLPQAIKPNLYAIDEHQVCDVLMLSGPIISRGRYQYPIDKYFTKANFPKTLNGNVRFASYVREEWWKSSNYYPDQDTANAHRKTIYLPNQWYAWEVGEEFTVTLDSYAWDGPVYRYKLWDRNHPDVNVVPKNPPTVQLDQFNRDTREGFTRYKFDPGKLTIAIQRFTIWAYPWCDQFAQKLYNFHRDNSIAFCVFCSNSVSEINGLITPFFPHFLDASYKDLVARQLNGNEIGYFNHKKSVRDFISYQEPIGLIRINLSVTKTTTVIVTYLSSDANCLSKQYYEILLKEGTNDFEFDFKYSIVNCSAVVSSLGGDNNAINSIEQLLTAKQEYCLYKKFDDYASFLEVNSAYASYTVSSVYDIRSYQRVVLNVNLGQYSSLYAANNNYWNNGNYLSDINPAYFDQISIEKTDNKYYSETYEMADSIRLQEIHAALNATKFSQNNGSTRIANLGFYIEFISQILGGSFNPDGSTRSIRQMRRIPDGSTVPSGWDRAQFSVNERGKEIGQKGGIPGEFAPGIVYQQRTNKLIPDKFDLDKSQIEGGDLILCENLPQLLEAFWDDLSKSLDMQNAGAGAIPNADGSGEIITYEGIHQLLIEIAYAVSRISGHTSETLISSMITQAVSKETLSGLGLPLDTSSLELNLGSSKGYVPYPVVAADSPSVTSQLGWVLSNLGRLMLSQVTPKPEDEPLQV